MAHYDEFQHDLMKGATFLSPELREHIDKILSALTTLKEATRGVQPLSKDTSLYSARLPMINLKEGCAEALKYLSNRTAQ